MKSKPTIKLSALPFLVLGAGGIGLVLRVLLYMLGMDSRGLLPRYHVLHVITLLLTVLVAAGLVYVIWPLGGSSRYRKNFPASRSAAAGIWTSALCLLISAFNLVRRADETLEYILTALAFSSVVSLLVTGWLRLRGKRPFIAFHSILCLFYVCNMVCQYRVWSGNPQLPDYLFQIFACVFLTLSSYYRAAFDLGMGRRRLFLFSSLMAVYLCFLSLVGSGDGMFYFACGLWVLSGLCVLDPPPRRPVTDTIRVPTIPETE